MKNPLVKIKQFRESLCGIMGEIFKYTVQYSVMWTAIYCTLVNCHMLYNMHLSLQFMLSAVMAGMFQCHLCVEIKLGYDLGLSEVAIVIVWKDETGHI